jgi:uncharacterized membrane protein YhhN
VSIHAQIVLLSTICLVLAAGYVFASWRGKPLVAGLSKAAASTSFVVLSLTSGALGSIYGKYVLIALVLSWIGDVCLISRRSKFLLAGIGAFFIAHVAYIVAFTQMSFEISYLIIAIVFTTVAGFLILRWLWTYLKGVYRVAVPAYLLVMAIMASVAIGVSAVPIIGIGAILFAVSDVSVARDRFVSRDIANKAWGLPLYYIAQLLFASSVITAT